MRHIPQVETLLSDPAVKPWIDAVGRPVVASVVRTYLAELREGIAGSTSIPEREFLVKHICDSCHCEYRRRTVPVLNCTGVLGHTNLGRSPISRTAWETAGPSNWGYSSVEMDLETGRRGNRSTSISDALKALTGCEAALLVNNNAGAIFLLLAALAKGKKVLVSRGELVQIGGGFRIPDILEQSGATLVEVGTTNITTVQDYLSHIDEDTAMVLRVHTSNFVIQGFTSVPSIQELAEALPPSVVLAMDQGSGCCMQGIPGEIPLRSIIAQGAALATCSADKLLGSVQAGCILGRKDLVQRIGNHPLYRILRVGKTVQTLFEASLVERINGIQAPTLSRFQRGKDKLRLIADSIIEGFQPTLLEIRESKATLGGGSTPGQVFPSLAVAVHLPVPAKEILAGFRDNDPPVIGIISGDTVLLDLAAIGEEDVPEIRNALILLLKRFPCIS